MGVASIAAAIAVANGKTDGLPVLGVDAGPVGVATSSGSARYVTLPAKGHTVVARVRQDGGQILASRVLPGNFTIPAVAYDGSASGLSADGRVLVLIQPRARFPRARTTLAVLDARQLRARTILRLRGDFSFDAISPKGRWLYLIQYVSPQDPTRYLVRAYDVRHGRLLTKPVVDPREQSEKMRGNPLSRAAGRDGRWAYTLYDGAGKTPFIHALDTSGRTARCIDLDTLAGKDYLWRLRLHLNENGSALTIRDGDETELVVDTRTFLVRTPAPVKAAARAAGRHDPGISSPLAGLAAVSTLVAAGALLLATRRRRRRLAFGR
ncbi:MAG: hypothetical protein M3R26_00545 [Actinomycetota bacterium]|nr:hypothetical protein [Actinomycetota bacterium]MDQ2980801.1 hypothetical protein [Actinomycetota bacterium]